MRGWFERMNWKMQKWMQGRYGQDELYLFLMIVGFVFLLLSAVSEIFMVLGIVFVLCALFRCYSRNLEKRRKERATYLRIISKPKNWLSLQRRKWKERKTHCYFKCNDCGQIMRVPKGKGKIVVTCPKCHKAHSRKT